MADNRAERIAAAPPEAIEVAKKFARGEYGEGGRFKYRFFTPDRSECGEPLPLFIFLHGGGECGSDNELHLVANRGAYAYALPESQAKHPCYILAPQCPKGLMFVSPEFESAFMPFLQTLCRDNAIDPARIYISGLSLGGMGTWHYICRYPELFAAAAPICGAGNPYTLQSAKNIPVWAFHAADDPVVPIDDVMPGQNGLPGMVGTRRMVEALRSIGGSVRFTEYPAGYIHEKFGVPSEYAGHFAWEPAYRDEELFEWLFSQSRALRDDFELVRPGVWCFNDYSGASYYLIEGRDKSLLIDTGMGKSLVLPLIRKITAKPIELAVTHVHGDHMIHADEFDRVYLPAGDREALPVFISEMMPGLKLKPDAVRYIDDGDMIDLGGVYVQAIALYGHTPGSLVYADYRHKCLFTGDAIGSGILVLMSIPCTLNISEYKANLDVFAERAKEFEDFIWLGGHRRQERGAAFSNPFAPLSEQPISFNPLHRRVVLDLSRLCAGLLSGDIKGEPLSRDAQNMPGGADALSASFGSAAIIYKQSQVK